MKKSKLVELIKYELEKSIMTKWFIILNIIMLIISIVSTNFTEIKKYTDIFSNYINIEIVDNENIIYENLESEFLKEEFATKVKLKKVNSLTHTEQNMEKHYLSMIVEPSEKDILKVKLISLKEIDSQYLDVIRDVITQKRNELLSGELEVDKDKIEFLMSDIEIDEIIVRFRHRRYGNKIYDSIYFSIC